MPRTSDSVTVEDDDELTQEIEAQVNEWSSNSNECFTVQLVRGDGAVTASFKPEYTYSMFGDEEAIFGYQDLSIDLTFRAHDLEPELKFSYGKIFEAQGEVRPTDIIEALRDFLPQSAFKSKKSEDDAADFQPPGEKIHTYKREGKTYETWCASLSDERAKKLVQNVQILIPMFIDGGSLLELEQSWTAARWKVFLVYEVDQNPSDKVSPYSFVGYGTSYRSFTFPDRLKTVQFDDFSPSSQPLEFFMPPPDGKTNELANPPDFDSPLDLPSRERLSQFLVLPPFHGAGHGQELYNTMYKHLTAPPNVREFTVEDPNERFDDLRDFCDLLYLRQNVPEFAALRINTDIPEDKMRMDVNIPTELIVPAEVRKQVMRDTKIMQRQFDRLVEMHTLSFIDNRSRSRLTKKEKSTNAHDKAYFFWRLYVKQRLYIFNADQLKQVEHTERVEKLESALDSVLEAYSEMIDKVKAKEKSDVEMGDVNTSADASAPKRKRPVIDDEEDDDDEEAAGAENEETGPNTNGHKKVKV
ncbi:hypothetical protein M409DRAFT_24220 [Zasmidium cellare ATCC 36951]|uniref:Histone acetyltransferase type B catalytic subunit n=1 Tax=Zasmidium cellare ATCC 36951 TaxID=1080233 RepID=A0A6A6CGQ9_ZASCE|nr:uncharacterized protein M409DRAFT_24220 [Zasmidium cellare ATCC 36951]KAF2165370.1 hypothetical protein M409DRAFT_24220 [Zasmidium cellare ATCC 36951]